jgi:hypothetical protein
MSGYFDPLAPFNTGNYDCDPYLEPDCSPPLYGPPLTVNQPIIVLVNDNSAALGSVQNAVNNLTGITASIVSLLGSIFNLLLGLLALLKQLWTKVLKPLADNLKGIIDDLKKKLDKILKPILDALKAQRQALLDFYNRFIRPLIAFLESIRRFIRILQIFHIHLLDGLDARIAALELKIMGPFFAALGRINTLGNWISYILNARMLIFRGLFLGSMNSYRGGSFTLLAGTPGYGTPLLPPAATDTNSKPPTRDTPQTAIAAVTAAGPSIAARFPNTPAGDLAACWSTPIGNVDLKGAIDELFSCIFS